MATWYRTGTVSVTNGSTAVNGSGTAWVSNTKAGEAIQLPDGRTYEIAAVVSDISIILATPYDGVTLSGQDYAIMPVRGVLKQAYDALTSAISTMQGHIDGALAGKFPAGTPTAPGIAFSGDQDTGLYSAESNGLAAATGGVRRWLLTSAAFNVDVPIKGAAVQTSLTDFDPDKLPTVNTSLHAALSRGGLYVPASEPGFDLDATNGGFAGLVSSANTGDFPAGGTGFPYVQNQQIYGDDAVLQSLTTGYASTGKPAVPRQFLRSRANDGAQWSDWAKVLTDHDIVGSVSQSGGLPTGAIVERGTNANGGYARFADGTQFCWHKGSVTDQAISSAYGSVFTGTRLWTFPATFIAAPSVPAPAAKWGSGASWGSAAAAGTGSCSMRFFDGVSRAAGTTFDFSFLAVGRWY